MNNNAYHTLKRAMKHGIINRKELKKQRKYSHPFIRRQIDYFLGYTYSNEPTIDLTTFTSNFVTESSSSAKDRLDETVVTFLLFMGNQLYYEKIYQTYENHGNWDTEYSWMMMYKMLFYSIFTMMYDIKWRNEYFFLIDDALIDLIKGYSRSLRELATKIGVQFDRDIYPAEKYFLKMASYSSELFGPYYWRIIHLMAEAFTIRDNNREDVKFAKILWRQYTTETLYRTLRCGICMRHYQKLVEDKYRKQLLDTPDQDYPTLWFNIHNDVTSNSMKSNKIKYTDLDFEKDRKFMRIALENANEKK